MTTKAVKRAPTTARAAVKIPAFPMPELAKGEAYAGIILKDGAPDYHLVAMAGEKELDWKDALDYAKKQGGALPDRREARLLWVNCAEKFQKRWYWTSEQHAAYSVYAWFQYFSDGGQYYGNKGYRYLARAVRRVPI